VDCFRNLKTATYTSREGLPSGLIGSILAAKNGQVLVGVEQSLEILRDGHIASIDSTKGLPPGKVTALAEDHEGRFWMGVGNDLVSYDGSRFTTLRYPNGQSSGAPAAIAVAQDGSIWASTVGRQRALIQVVNGTLTTVLSNRPVGDVLVADKEAGVWIASAGGVAHYSGGTVTSVPIIIGNGSTKSPSLNALAIGNEGEIFAAGGRGIWGVRDGKAQMLGVANGLPCQVANGLSMSRELAIVIRTSCGLLVIGPTALKGWWKDAHALVPYSVIDSFDGAHLSPSTFSPGMSLAADGRIWNANAGSIQVFDPDHLRSNPVEPPVHVETVSADGKQLTASEGLILPPLTRDIELDYTALSFTVPQKVRFRYLLEGRDKTWQSPGSRRTAFYQNLGPGRYRFRVVAANNDGVWNTPGSVLDFSVKPAWFQTLWFRLLSITAAMLVMFFLYRLRLRSLSRAINARFDERLDERTRMALELHDTFLQTVQGSKMVADDALDAGSDQVRMRKALEKLSVWLEQAVTEGRAALHALRVTTTERNHLAQFLERTAKEHCDSRSISVALTVIRDAKDLHPIVRDEITRISEEAIRNTCLHSRASQLSIELRYANDLSISFQDNGIGIDPEVVDMGKEGHFGIKGMRERSARLRARITIKSTLNAGTSITLQVPGAVIYRYGDRSLWNRIRSPGRNRSTSLDEEGPNHASHS
jgi:signal transduction histidine kinase